MGWIEENIGEGYQQVIVGVLLFIVGAAMGWMESTDPAMSAADIYVPSLLMLSGAMVTLLGISFGTDHEDDRTNDLRDAINDLTARMNSMRGQEE